MPVTGSNASASYVISAVDQTKEAIRSIRENFRSLNTGVKATASSINLALGFLAGASLKSAFRTAVDATAEAAGSTSAFAKALDEAKKAAGSLLASKQGLPEATIAMQGLVETLKDPTIVSTMDAIATSAIKMGAAITKAGLEAAAGWKIILTGKGGNESVDIDNQILDLQQRLKSFEAFGGTPEVKRDLRLQIEGLKQEYERSLRGDKGKGLQSVTGGGEANASILDLVDAQSKGLVAAQNAAEGYEQALKELADTSEKLPGMTGDAVEAQFAKVSAEAEADMKSKKEAADYYQKAWEDMRKQQHETEQRDSTVRDEEAKKAQETIGAWQDIFFTGMDQGFDGLYAKWKQTLKMMAAEALASGVFSLIKGGTFSGGFSKGLSTATTSLGKLFGFANGGSILPGGSGSTDSQVVAFRKSPSEQVDIYTPGGRGGGAVIHMHNDFRGATVDAIKYFQSIAPALVQQAITGARMAVRDDISRRAYG